MEEEHPESEFLACRFPSKPQFLPRRCEDERAIFIVVLAASIADGAFHALLVHDGVEGQFHRHVHGVVHRHLRQLPKHVHANQGCAGSSNPVRACNSLSVEMLTTGFMVQIYLHSRAMDFTKSPNHFTKPSKVESRFVRYFRIAVFGFLSCIWVHNAVERAEGLMNQGASEPSCLNQVANHEKLALLEEGLTPIQL